MKADQKKFQELNKTKFEQRGKEFEFGIPITNSVCLGNSIAVGFGDGTVRIFRSGKNSKTIKAHNGVVLCMAEDGNNILTGGDDGRFLKISIDFPYPTNDTFLNFMLKTSLIFDGFSLVLRKSKLVVSIALFSF